MLTVFPRKQWLPAQHLGKNASHTPHINRLGILLECQHNLGSTVPSCGHIFGHEARVVFGGSRRSSQTEVADFQIAIGIEKKIRWFEISVEDICRVHGLERSESLVDEVLAVVIGKLLSSYDAVHIRLHEFLASGQWPPW